MNKKNYLSDDEIDLLISGIEESDLVQAPVDMLDNILAVIDINRKKVEFRKYCLRVITSVAAAIALLIMIPEFMINGGMNIPKKDEVMAVETQSKEDIIGEIDNEIMCSVGKSHVLRDIFNFKIID